MADYGATERVRRLAAEAYLEPARRRGQKTVTIHSGELARVLVEKKLLQPNRYPIVCNALRSKRFSRENHVTLEEVKTSAPSGQSSTVSFVFKLDRTDSSKGGERDDPMAAFMALRGILKDSYAKVGGAEVFHTTERENWER